MKSISAIFSRNVRIYRDIRGLTQAQLAEQVEISTNFLSQIEGDKKFPSPQVVDRFIRALEVQPHQLFLEKTDLDAVSDIASASVVAHEFQQGLEKQVKSFITKFFEH